MKKSDGVYTKSLGTIVARFAKDEREIRACQKLRYKIFFKELGAQSGAEENQQIHIEKRDFDEYDSVCHHIIMYDMEKKGSWNNKIIGTYRLIEKSHISTIGHFFSEYEFSVDHLKDYPSPILELGRACVKKKYRKNFIFKLLWNVIADFVIENNIKLLFGEADFPTTDLDSLKEPLSFLKQYYEQTPSSPDFRKVKSKQQTWNQVTNLIPADQLDLKKSFSSLAPLMKGYIRLGCNIGDGYFVDTQFNSTSIAILLDMNKLDAKYKDHYEKQAESKG